MKVTSAGKGAQRKHSFEHSRDPAFREYLDIHAHIEIERRLACRAVPRRVFLVSRPLQMGFRNLSLCLLAIASKGAFSSPVHHQQVFQYQPQASNDSNNVIPGHDEGSVEQSGSPLNHGFVAFGDSYAGGIGTGYTSWDGCRTGQNSYPLLLNATADHFVFYESHACTGDRTDQLMLPGGQIDSWYAPNLADFGTLSIGGDDLDFAVILDACVLRYQGTSSPNCEEWIEKAKANLRLTVDFKMWYSIQRIMDKGGPEFELYVTGYPRFFNADTDWCDNVTFWFWQPEHHVDAPRSGDWAYLTKERRTVLNQLVDELNAIMFEAIEWVNAFGEERVHVLDPNPLFEGHRFCDIDAETGEKVQEPDLRRKDTWFFLSSWPDNDDQLPGGRPEASVDQLSIESYLLLPTPLTEGETCLQRYQENQNRTEYSLCSIINANQTNSAIGDDGNFRRVNSTTGYRAWSNQMQAEGVHWYWPTEWIKTFHPKSMGYNAYAKGLVELLGHRQAIRTRKS